MLHKKLTTIRKGALCFEQQSGKKSLSKWEAKSVAVNENRSLAK